MHGTQATVALYRALGWAPVRVPPLGKAPVDDAWPTTEYPPESFADGDNIGVKLGAASGGLVDVDLDCPEAIALAPLFLPTTATFGRVGEGKTPGAAIAWSDPRVTAARHWLYRCTVKTKKPPRSHIELRSTGLQTIFPGSIHESGVSIDWINPAAPLACDDTTLLACFGRLGAATVLARVWPSVVGDKHHTVLALAGALWHCGWSLDDALALLLPAMGLGDVTHHPHREAAIRDTFIADDRARTGWPTVEQLLGPLDTKAIQRAVELVPTVTLATTKQTNLELHDVGNAERFLVDYGDDLRAVRGLGWIQWDGARWESDVDPTSLVIRSVRTFGAMGQAERDPNVIKWAHQSMSAGKLHAARDIAESLDTQRTVPRQLDADPWLLACTNGTLDLRTGILGPHDRTNLITRQAGVPFDPSAGCPRFAQFLGEVFAGDIELARYLLRFLGYGLTGDVREQVFSVWYGHGANGKSTLVELLLHVLGDYAQRMSDDLLTAKSRGRDSSAPNPDVARLRGTRFVVGTESGEGLRWNEPLVKTLTGGDRIVARHLHKEPIEFDPTWKIALAVNHKPIVRGTDHGIWRRIHLVPFEVRFTGARDNKSLIHELKREAPGVLAMLVAGCMDWQARGLDPPARVRAAVDEYRHEHDVVGSFLREATRVNERGSITKSQLYRVFRQWAVDSSEYVHGKHAFQRLMRERGIMESADDVHWIGLDLVSGAF